MAKVLGGRPPPPRDSRLGDRFEFEVEESLRQGLPEDYFVIPNVLLVNSRSSSGGRGGKRNERRAQRKTDSDRELDFIVAGPCGVTVVEAKAWNDVAGPFFGEWERRKAWGGKVAQCDRIRSPFEPRTMKTNLERVRSCVNDVWELRGYGTAHGVVVLPKGSRIHVTDNQGQEVRRMGRHHLVTLDELPSTILGLQPPQHEDGRHRPRLSSRDVQRLSQLFHAGSPTESPQVGAYTKRGRPLDRCQAVNGVKFSCWEIVHNEMGWVREGKAYDLTALGTADRQQFNEQIKRHAAVGHSIEHANVHGILDMFLHGDELWVVQKRVPGRRLHRIIEANEQGMLSPRQVLRDIAAGLEALHQARFVRRELSPMSVLVTADGHAVLTDFELSKSLDGGPTVAVDQLWLQNPYVAPEVLIDAHHGAPTADVYSWGSVAYALLTGKEYDRNPNPAAMLSKSRADAQLRELVAKSLQLIPERRPQTAAQLLSALG